MFVMHKTQLNAFGVVQAALVKQYTLHRYYDDNEMNET